MLILYFSIFETSDITISCNYFYVFQHKKINISDPRPAGGEGRTSRNFFFRNSAKTVLV